MRQLYLGLVLTLLLTAGSLAQGQDARYGNFGGPPTQKEPAPPFSIDSTYRDVRWFPTHVRWSPDDSHLLVSLCHTLRPSLCRIGKYFIATKQWEILPYEDKRTYRWPVYHPDGKEIAVSTGSCDEQYRCALADYVLIRMAPDGSSQQPVGDVIATDMSFSRDGKKLIYWRLGGMSIRGRTLALADLYEIDWPSGKETALTAIGFMGEELLRPRYVENGAAFIFQGGGYGMLNAKSHRGVNYGRIQDAPLKPINQHGGLVSMQPYGLLDVSRDDRILYLADLTWKKEANEPIALTIRPGKAKRGIGATTPKDVVGTDAQERYFGRGSALFLRSMKPASLDEAGFDVSSPFEAALSSDATRVAFLRGGSAVSSAGVKLGLIGHGDVQTTNIDWPKLELKPGRQR